jgi:Na+-transporting NADH:ubiquinone oxidoreductase subunit C
VAKQDSIGKILGVAFALCIVASVLVSGAAVMLKPQQVANKALDFKRNVLGAVGLQVASSDVEAVYAQRIEARIVDLNSGKFTEEYDPANFDQVSLTGSDATSIALEASEDVAKILRRENFSIVYFVKSEAGEIENVILPIRGKGLWSTMYGLLILENDLNTVAGVGFYQHGETPGLGGEIDNPNWQKTWVGKKVFDESGVPAFDIVKSKNPSLEQHQVDSLSGATLTSKGVAQAVQFWLSEKGFKTFLKNYANGEA